MKDRSKNLKKHEAFQRGLENYATSMATYNVDDSITIYVKTILREYIKEVSKVVEITKREKERINFIINNIEFFIDEWNSKEEKDEKMKKLADAVYKALGGNIT